MIDFIIKLEDMLKQSGHEDWEIRYNPEEKVYSLTLDGDTYYFDKKNYQKGVIDI